MRVLLAVLLSWSCCWHPALADNSSCGQAPASLHLGIAYVNDTHGRLLPYKVLGEEGWAGFARLKSAIDTVRQDQAYSWVTLHAGDAFQGTPLSNLLTGAVDIECMNRMGFDAMCLGNHEFDFGCDVLSGRMRDSRFAVLSANLIDKRSGVHYALPYTILERGGYRIGIIGLTTDGLLTQAVPSVGDVISVTPAVEAARSYASLLREAGCDIVLALTHLGYVDDAQLARQVPELDVVIGGHSHTFLQTPLEVETEGRMVIVTQDGCFAQDLGVLKLDFTRDAPTERFHLQAYNNEFIPLNPALPQDAALAAYIETYNGQLQQELERVVCTARTELPVDGIRTSENALADLVLDALRGELGCDAALFNSGNFRTGLPAGPIRFGDLYQALPYDNFLVKLTVTGAQLRDLLAYAGTQNGKGGAPQVSGLRVRYVDGALAEASINGAALDDAVQYTVLTSSYVAAGGDGYPLREDPYGPGYTGRELRSTFANWAEQQGEIGGTLDGRLVYEWDKLAQPGA